MFHTIYKHTRPGRVVYKIQQINHKFHIGLLYMKSISYMCLIASFVNYIIE